jgi:hypothetical protein
MAKKPHCRFGRHTWVKRETTRGDVYGECTRCGERDWGLYDPDRVGDGGAPVNKGWINAAGMGSF